MTDTAQPHFKNPLEENSRITKVAEPCVMVIFGATGDLTSRKLFPALYNLNLEGQLPGHFACVGFARRDKTNESFRKEMHDAVNEFSRKKPVEEHVWETFSQQIFYHKSEFDQDEGYEQLKSLLNDLDNQFGTKGSRVFYLSVQPSFFPLIIEKLNKHGLIYNSAQVQDKWSRVIIEKPFGHDLNSAEVLQKEISVHLTESQIYRIDHYLGKETVQNLLMFRFSNPIFEALWNNKHIDHLEITVAEDIGIGTRGRFFEEAGELRDIVQNHMMQLLSLVCMEPPTGLSADSIRNEKVKVMESIRPFPIDEIDKYVVRGQYGPGYVDGVPVKGYRQEENVSPTSTVETYVAVELYVDNWRWAGVPFFLRAGKRLPKRATDIAITFKEAPGFLFTKNREKVEQNVLVIRIQPNEGISLLMNYKVPGLTSMLLPVKMDFRHESYFGQQPPEAYERLISDCMSGDNTLFAHADEVLASWKLFTPVLEKWSREPDVAFPNYESGTWGPKESEELLEKYERQWRLI